jgi:two-component system, response regulator YesN
MNLIIMDNEAMNRQILSKNLHWADYGITVTGVASNGNEALQLIETQKPDIILCDILTDDIDALTLSRIIIERQYDMKIIFLSSLNSFEYAQQAIDLGVFKYLTKPADPEEIIEAVLESATKLRKEREEKNKQQILQKKWLDNLPRLGEMFLKNWIAGKYVKWEIDHYSTEFGVQLADQAQYVVSIIEADPIHEDKTSLLPQDIELIPVAILSILSEYYEDNPCWVFSDKHGATVLIFSCPISLPSNELMLSVYEAVTDLLKIVEKHLNLTASSGISEVTDNREFISLCYEQAKTALRERIVYGPNVVVPYHKNNQKAFQLPAEVKLARELEIALETDDKIMAEKTMDQLFLNCIEKAGSVEEVQENTLMLSSLLIHIIQKQQWSIKEVVGEDYIYFHNLSLLATKEQIRIWMQRTIRNYLSYIRNKRTSSSHQIIKAVFKMIEQHIDQELTLSHVANQLFLNSSYLSRLFKQVTGVSFSSYVLERKMQRAKKSLHEGTLVYDAAASVGYRDVSYFTKVFRKFWGVTPREIIQMEE